MNKTELEKMLDGLIAEAISLGWTKQRMEALNIKHQDSEEPALREIDRLIKYSTDSQDMTSNNIEKIKKQILKFIEEKK